MPISFLSVNEENMHNYLEMLKKCKADRVFICLVGFVYDKNALLYKRAQSLKNIISYFKQNGFEVGVWVDGFGHGGLLPGQEKADFDKYTDIVGVDGKTAMHALCPSDKNFLNDFAEGLKFVANLGPDLIMIDDDFRINGRMSYYLGCFCDYHYGRYCELVGEKVDKKDLERLITTGEKNKYRDAYFDMIAETLLNFAKTMRRAVDEVNNKVRLSISSPLDGWDTSGTSLVEIAKAFAGNTKPFARIACAPYWNNNIISVTEASRLEFFYGKDSGVEFFAEGDTYPRPRYNVPSKPLELFELILSANGDGDGVLSYLFDYLFKCDYETGYVKRFANNEEKRVKVQEFFSGKNPVGVKIFSVANKVRNASMPNEIVNRSISYFESIKPFIPGASILSMNSIPTCYYGGDYPVLLYGENAKYIDLKDLKNGAIIDVAAAKILQSRGIDVGLISSSSKPFDFEYFVESDDKVGGVSHPKTQEITVDKNAKIESYFMPNNTPASYRYENKDGLKFFVMAFEFFNFDGDYSANYLNSYYRQEQIISVIPWLCNKVLPASVKKNPNLYILTSKDDKGDMAILFANVNIDEVLDEIVTLDGEYKLVDQIGLDGEVNGNAIKINRIEPYGFTAIKLEKK